MKIKTTIAVSEIQIGDLMFPTPDARPRTVLGIRLIDDNAVVRIETEDFRGVTSIQYLPTDQVVTVTRAHPLFD